MSMQIGQSASITLEFDASLIEAFAELTGDKNPIHLDEEFAAKTRFGRRIAHGMLLGGFISRLIATDLPGPGTVYLGQELSFRSPVFLGDVVTVMVRVASVRQDKPIVTLDTVCTNQDGIVVAEGVATVRKDD